VFPKYINNNVIKTYACKKQIATSKQVTMNVIIHGKIKKKLNHPGIKKILKEKEINICCNMCPESIFANRRIVKLKSLAKYDTVSKKIRNHVKLNGKPFGIKIPKKFHLWYIIPTKLIAKNIVTTK